MPVYDQLLLEYGGGIINASFQSDAYKKDACVAIGIGGTGIAALKQLKRKVYQQIAPDNPEDPVHKYGHIRFIAIDSDGIDPGKGKGKLLEGEMFSIKNTSLPGILGTKSGKANVKNDYRIDWMDLDNISALNAPDGAGGIRQVGRYLLIVQADELKQKIHLECTSAMHAADTNSVTVYIFAGLSGGTGSGCFIDTCYIVRQLMHENGWSASGIIMGFFFLPDVVISQQGVATIPVAVKYNQANGYAAMKELDYLMNLTLAQDHFYQDYGDFIIDTQEPPVDMCHLVSATKENGQLQPDGFDYCINVAADYVMSYLIDVKDRSDDGTDSQGITLRGVLANIYTQIGRLQWNHGAPKIYHVVGASNAEIPMTQISTYLAAGFMNRFAQKIGREKIIVEITKQKVNEWAEKMKLTPNGILGLVNHGTNPLTLPDIDRTILKSQGQMLRGKAPESWANPGNVYLDNSEEKRTANCNSLKVDIEDYSLETMPTGQTPSIITSIFNLLYSISTDSELGPYYAAYLIHNTGYDMGMAIDGVIETYERQKRTQELYLYGRGSGGIADDIVQASADFIGSHFFNNRAAYYTYKQTVEDYYITVNRIKELEDAISVMKTVKLQLSRLYQNYYAPMIEMLDNVKESFDEDMIFLQLPKATAYTWQILKLSDVQENLDQAIRALQPKALVTDFMQAVVSDYKEWINRDSDRITAFISKFMINIFDKQMNTSLQDYLEIKYPEAATPQDLADTIEREIINPLFEQAASMLWYNTNSDDNMVDYTYQTTQLFVPVSAWSVCQAADEFRGDITVPLIVRRTGLENRIFFTRLISGVPLCSYNMVSLLKDAYDKNKQAGVDLYSKSCGMIENADDKVLHYKRNNDEGAITENSNENDKYLYLLESADKGEALSTKDIALLEVLEKLHCCDYIPGPSLLFLKNIRKLSFAGSKMTEVPDCLTLLDTLEELDLSDTSISLLPSGIGSMRKLRRVGLRNLKLETLPMDILDLPLKFVEDGREGIDVRGLKVSDMERLDILFVSRPMTKAWFAERDRINKTNLRLSDNVKKSTVQETVAKERPIDEVKVVFLGDAEVGKTLTIQRVLLGGAPVEEYHSEATRGIVIEKKTIKVHDRDIKLRLWDFGGQDIYHAMHRLFFTNRTIYVVMVSARSTHVCKNAKDWLRNVQTFAPACPVLLLVNKIDDFPDIYPELEELKEEFSVLYGVRRISALKFDKVDFNREVLDALVSIIDSMEDTVRYVFPESWMRLKEKLENSNESYITEKDYEKLCDSCGVNESQEVRDGLHDWLCDLGICFSGNSRHLGELYAVLNPIWITRAVYFMLTYRAEFSGGIVSAKVCFKLQEMKKIEQDTPSYKVSGYQHVLHILRQFRLAYPIGEEEFFVPMLCTTQNRAYSDSIIKDAKSLHFLMEYYYLPVNLLYYLLVEMHRFLVRESIWSNGCVFEMNESGLKSAVFIQDNNLNVYVKSENPVFPPSEFLAHLRNTIVSLSHQIGLVFTEKIEYRRDGKSDLFDYQHILERSMAGDTVIDTSTVFGPVSISDILNQSEGALAGRRRALLTDILKACTSLQKDMTYAHSKENPRNSFICSILRAKGYDVADQTLSGASSSGKTAGSLDAKIFDGERPFAIFEGENLELNSLKNNKTAKDYIRDHLERLLHKYNPEGFPQGYLVTYLNCRKDAFVTIWQEYKEYVIRECRVDEFVPTDYHERLYEGVQLQRVLEMRHDCGGLPVVIIHIVVRLMTEEAVKTVKVEIRETES